jgi:hypothetical protein
VNRFVKIAFVCAFFAAFFALNLRAQPASPPAAMDASASAAAAPVAEDTAQPEVVPAAAPVVYTIPGLGLPITNSMICTWIVAALILIIVRSTTPKTSRKFRPACKTYWRRWWKSGTI